MLMQHTVNMFYKSEDRSLLPVDRRTETLELALQHYGMRDAVVSEEPNENEHPDAATE